MKNNKFIFFLSSVSSALVAVGASAFALAVVYHGDIDSRWICVFAILIPYTVTLIGAWKFKHLITFFVTGAASAAVMMFLPFDLLDRVVLTVLSAVLFLIRLFPRITTEGESGILDTPGIPGVIFFAALYICAILLKSDSLMTLEYWLCFSYILLLFIYFNTLHLKEFMRERNETANLPAGLIHRTNKRMFMLFMCVTIFLMCVIPLLPINTIVHAIGSALHRFLIWLFSFLPETELGEEVIEEVAQEAGNGGGMIPLDPGETPRWLEFIQELFYRILTFATFSALIFGIGYGIVKIFQRFYRSTTMQLEGDETGDIKEMLDLTAKENTKAPREPFMDRFKPNAQIRRQYKKTLLKSLSGSGTKADSMPGSGTPSQLEAFSGLSADTEGTEVLHGLYETARYSKTGCTSEDVSRLKGIKV